MKTYILPSVHQMSDILLVEFDELSNFSLSINEMSDIFSERLI